MAYKQRGQVYEHGERGARKRLFGSAARLTQNGTLIVAESVAESVTGMLRDVFAEKKLGEAAGVVADLAALLQQVGGEVGQSHSFELAERGPDNLGALFAIAAQHLRGSRSAIDHRRVKYPNAGVCVDGADVIGDGVALGLAGLRHEISNVNALGIRASDSFCDAFDQEIGNDAGVERAGADENQVCVVKRREHFGERTHAAGDETNTADSLLRAGNFFFTGNYGTVFEFRFEGDVLGGRREDASANGEHSRGNVHRFREIAGDVGE